MMLDPFQTGIEKCWHDQLRDFSRRIWYSSSGTGIGLGNTCVSGGKGRLRDIASAMIF